MYSSKVSARGGSLLDRFGTMIYRAWFGCHDRSGVFQRSDLAEGASLHRLIPEDAKNELPTPAMPNVPSAVVPQGKYAGMSVRWAILNLLAEDATAPMTTGDIAEALLKAGIQTGGKSFSANVSAVLSGMNHNRKEVVAKTNGWVITEIGKSAWTHISAKRQAQKQQFTLSSNVQ